MSVRAIWGVSLIGLIIGVVGCTSLPRGGRGESNPVLAIALSPTPVSDNPRPGSPSVGIGVGNVAPDFELNDLQGQTVKLSGFQGQVVMLNFWAVWCGYCRVEFPEIQAVYDGYRGKGFIVLAINIQEKKDLVEEFVQDTQMTFPVLLDRLGSVTAQYRVRGLPTSYFVDQQGVIFEKHIGPVDEASLKEYLARVGVH